MWAAAVKGFGRVIVMAKDLALEPLQNISVTIPRCGQLCNPTSNVLRVKVSSLDFIRGVAQVDE